MTSFGRRVPGFRANNRLRPLLLQRSCRKIRDDSTWSHWAFFPLCRMTSQNRASSESHPRCFLNFPESFHAGDQSCRGSCQEGRAAEETDSNKVGSVADFPCGRMGFKEDPIRQAVPSLQDHGQGVQGVLGIQGNIRAGVASR